MCRRVCPGALWLLFFFCCSSSVATSQDGNDGANYSRKSDLGAPRIVGGSMAQYNEYPYIVSLLSLSGRHVCGGSLIAPDMVLSAAHCMNSFAQIEIGRHNKANVLDNQETFAPLQQIIHPNYDPTKYPFDVLLIQIDGQSTKKPVRLNRNRAVPQEGDELTVIGFGLVDPEDDSSSATVVQHVTVNVVSNEECEKATNPQMQWNTYNGLITSDMLCATDVKEDACSGDSGGPLVDSNVRGDDTQVGIVSWGFGCASELFPGVYSSVSHEHEWIDRMVCQHSAVPPDDFNCPGTGTETLDHSSLNDGSVPAGKPVPVTIVISLDEYAYETGWRVEDSSQNIVFQVVAGTYQSKQEVHETLFLASGESYTFIIIDSWGDGVCCKEGQGYYRIYMGHTVSKDSAVVLGSGEFGREARHTFIVSGEPLEQGAFDEPVPLTAVINMDRYPEEIGWTVERIGSNRAELTRRPPGTYRSEWQGGTVVETILLPRGGLYRFDIADVYGDGITDGFYKLYLGTRDITDERALIVDQKGTFGFGRQHLFLSSPEEMIIDPGASLKLEIKFYDNPEHIGWVLEMEKLVSNVVASREASFVPNRQVIDFREAYEASAASQAIYAQEVKLPPLAIGENARFYFTSINNSDPDGGSANFKLYDLRHGAEELLTSGTGSDTLDFVLEGTWDGNTWVSSGFSLRSALWLFPFTLAFFAALSTIA